MHRSFAVARFVLPAMILALAGCGGSAAQTQVLPQPGNYEPAAQPTPRLRAALPDVAVGNAVGAAPDVDLMAAASDELLSVLQSSDRFDLTERQRLHQMLAEQNLTGMIQPGQLVHPGPIRGVDLVFLGQLNDLSIKKQPPPETMSVSGLMQATRIEKPIPRLMIDATVNLSLVDVRTGAVNVTSTRKVHLSGTPQELGLKLTSDQLAQASEVRLSPQDTRTVLRFVLDEPLRPMLPLIDRWAASLPPPGAPSIAVTAQPLTAQPQATTRPGTEKKALLLICPNCGFRLTGDEEFCPNCHFKLK